MVSWWAGPEARHRRPQRRNGHPRLWLLFSCDLTAQQRKQKQRLKVLLRRQPDGQTSYHTNRQPQMFCFKPWSDIAEPHCRSASLASPPCAALPLPRMDGEAVYVDGWMDGWMVCSNVAGVPYCLLIRPRACSQLSCVQLGRRYPSCKHSSRICQCSYPKTCRTMSRPTRIVGDDS